METTVKEPKKETTPPRYSGLSRWAQITRNLTLYIPAVILGLLVITAIFAPLVGAS